MRAMKDSGIAWIGEIPKEWNTSKIKFIADFDPACDFENVSAEDKVAYAPMECIKQGFYEARDALYEELPHSLTPFQNGDIVMAKVTPCFENGNIAIMNELPSGIGLGSSELFVFRTRNIVAKYLFYWLQNSDFIQRACSTMTGVGGLKRVSPFFCKNCEIHFPPFTEQHRIADYLDRKCSQIDAIIARQQEVIEKLKAYKLSVITEAVTKGLNPHAPMKDSGVEWIGEIPEQWRMIRLKFLMSDIIDCPHETPAYSDDGEYLVIRTADQDLGKLRADQDMYRLNKNEYQNRIRRMALNKNDIVYGREGERWGLACLVPESNKYCLGQRMLQFRCKNELLLPHFAVWALNSKYIYLQGSVDTIGSTSPHVNISTVQNFLMPVPQICEQQEITEYIDKKMLQLDKDLLHRNTLIRKLIEYKKSLVYEVVTGKKEVI